MVFARAGGKIIDRGPGRFMNFGRGWEGPGVVILAGAPVEHWKHRIKYFVEDIGEDESWEEFVKTNRPSDISKYFFIID